jgi:hypothetical protein
MIFFLLRFLRGLSPTLLIVICYKNNSKVYFYNFLEAGENAGLFLENFKNQRLREYSVPRHQRKYAPPRRSRIQPSRNPGQSSVKSQPQQNGEGRRCTPSAEQHDSLRNQRGRALICSILSSLIAAGFV